MPLRSLVFSSRPETANPLLQALRELDLVVEHSVEIFAAIRELTSRSFDLVVADLDEGPEAEFLLRTVSELRINSNAFVLAATSAPDSQSGPHSRADLVLSKPLIPEQIKYSLLGCDRFLVAYMRSGAIRIDSPSSQRTTSPSQRPISTAVPPHNLRSSVHRQ